MNTAAQPNTTANPVPPTTPATATTPAEPLILALMAVVVFFFCLWGPTNPPLISGMPFQDPDDVMRMLQALALYDGGSWFDLTQPRINPPEGLAMHWSRLPDLPILGLLALSEPWLGRDQAIWLAASLTPPILGVAYFLAFVWAAEPLTGRGARLQAGLMAMVSYLPLVQFTSGRIDHHGWQLLLAVTLAGALLRLATDDQRLRPALVAGLCAALGLWIGAEAIPLLAFSSLALTLLWWRGDVAAIRGLTILGATTLSGTLLLIPLALGPQPSAISACDAFSGYAVILAGAVCAFAGLNWTLERRLGRMTPARRLVASVLVGLPLLYLLARLFPHCLGSPYGELPPVIQSLVARTRESLPLTALLEEQPAKVAGYLALPLLGLIVTGARIWRLPRVKRSPWIALMTLQVGTLLLPWWQNRGVYIANLIATLALTWLAAWSRARLDRTTAMLPRLAWRAGPALLVMGLPTLAMLLIREPQADPPPERGATCDLSGALAVLNQGTSRDQAPLLIAAPINQSVPILWSTPHAVLAAPYHRNAAGLQDNEAILEGDEPRARDRVLARGVDLVLLCPRPAAAIQNQDPTAGQLQGRLLADDPPDWLVELSTGGGARLWGVVGHKLP